MRVLRNNYRLALCAFFGYLLVCSALNVLLAHVMVVDSEAIWHWNALRPLDTLFLAQIPGILITAPAFLLFAISPSPIYATWLRGLLATLGWMIQIILIILGCVTPLEIVRCTSHHGLVSIYCVNDISSWASLALVVADICFCLGLSIVIGYVQNSLHTENRWQIIFFLAVITALALSLFAQWLLEVPAIDPPPITLHMFESVRVPPS